MLKQDDRYDGFWIPDNIPTFKTGDRVRIRLNGECGFRCLNEECGESFHDWVENGDIGTITVSYNYSGNGMRCDDNISPGCRKDSYSKDIAIHHYGVSIDRLPGEVGGWFAPVEIIRLEDLNE